MQYFLWYLSILPLVLPSLGLSLTEAVLMLGAWFAGQVLYYLRLFKYWGSRPFYSKFRSLKDDIKCKFSIFSMVSFATNCFVFIGSVAGTSILPWIWRKRHVFPSLVGFHCILCYQLRDIVESRVQVQAHTLVPERTVSEGAWCTQSQAKTIAWSQRQEKSIRPVLPKTCAQWLLKNLVYSL